MRLIDFINFISENGKYKVFGYYKNYTLYFRRDDGCIFTFRG